MRELKISDGNIKMGAIKSVSLPPVTTCRSDAPCVSGCYARRMCRYPSVKDSYENNYMLYLENSDEFFEQLKRAANMERFFRYHTAGDIPDREYFINMIKVANECPYTEFLAFTKQFEIVNDVLFTIEKPKNLHIVFSRWGDFVPLNPHNLPESDVIFNEEDITEDMNICPGNCFDCCFNNCGCWTLEDGEVIYFKKH